MEVKVYLPSTSFNPAPIALTFAPDTTAKELVQELSKKFHVQGDEGSLVITPTSSTTGGVVEPRTCIKSFNLDPEERLELWRAPYLINVLLVSDFTSPDPVKQRKEIVFDYGSPLSYNIPLLRRIFSLQEEFMFQYVPSLDDDDKAVKWLDSKKSLSDQSFEGTSWLMCYPISTLLKTKDGTQRCTEIGREGYLIKQTQKGSKKTAKRRRWAVLKDQFLFYFKNKGDTVAAGVIPLEYYTLSMVQIKQMPSLHLKRAIGRFEGNADLYILYGDEGDDLLKWKEALQRKCLGTGSIFGVTLDEMMNRPSIKPLVPDIVVTLSSYLLEQGLDAEGILRISGSNAMVNYYRDLFDRGAEVDLSAMQDIHIIASLLKLYFRELPDPAIPFMFYEEIMNIMNLQGPDKKTDVLPLLLEVMARLPDAHFHVLKHMLQFLFTVAQHAATNLMGLPNLGTVMGPNLLRPPDHKLASFVQDSPLISECVQLLIKHHEQIHKSENTPKSQPRRAPMMSEEELKHDSQGSEGTTIPANPGSVKIKRPAKVNKGKERSDRFDIIKGGIFMDPIPKIGQAQPSPKVQTTASPPPPPSTVLDSVIAAQQNVTQELQHHLATNPPQPPPSLTFTPPTSTTPRASEISPQPQQILHRPLPPQPPPTASPTPPPRALSGGPELPKKFSPKSGSRNPISTSEEIAKPETPKFARTPSPPFRPGDSAEIAKNDNTKSDTAVSEPAAKSGSKTDLKIELSKDKQPAKDSAKVEQKGADKNKPMSPRKLELTTTATRIIPPSFPSKTPAKKEPLPPLPSAASRSPPPSHPPPPTPSRSPPPTTEKDKEKEKEKQQEKQEIKGDKERIDALEDESKGLKQKVEEEIFKRKLLELKLELLVQRMNEMEAKISGMNK